jgi:hypothetical protein
MMCRASIPFTVMVREGGPPTTCGAGASQSRVWSAEADHDKEKECGVDERVTP